MSFRAFHIFRNLSTSTKHFIGIHKDVVIPEAIPVYTDGSCFNNGKPNAISSIGVYFPTKMELSFGEIIDSKIHTNQKAEVLAILRAVEVCSSLSSPIRIYTDSYYAFLGFSKWIHTWIAKDRRTLIKNHEIFFKTLDALTKCENQFYISHVSGHSGLKGNDEADKLARVALKTWPLALHKINSKSLS